MVKKNEGSFLSMNLTFFDKSLKFLYNGFKYDSGIFIPLLRKKNYIRRTRKKNCHYMESFSEFEKKVPSAPLDSVISEYVFRKIRVEKGDSITRIMPLRLVSSIDFFLDLAYDTIDCASGKLIPFKRCTIRGPRTYSKNLIKITGGNFISFSIRLKPGGLFGLLGIPVPEFRNEAIDASTVLSEIFNELTEKLQHCSHVTDCISIAEPFLLKLIKQSSRKIHPSAAVSEMTSLLHRNMIPPSIHELEKKVCLSPRQLERNFIKEIGINPKLYSRMVRFTNLLNDIRRNGNKWASVAYEFNYADQMHLIKDFQHFLGLCPSEFDPADFAF
jgi:AraC-like DNA-binding protein